ncbi:hypothetical protein BD410DRAFT_49463 [Rickenella mellea]|uniref:snRNA-activating protein complex subunit 3 n=1 Tax=Rickenella mellea TaxID=50990 RepID=A0A4R5XFU0_9AGAM|nr:hypothetical protein BD410DRAFT_49463 [Rickenella mellea]
MKHYANESLFGPPSELIHIATFIQDASSRKNIGSKDASVGPSLTPEQLPTTLNEVEGYAQNDDIAAECSVDDLRDLLNNVFRDPMLFCHVARSHEENLGSIQATAEARDASNKSRKRRKMAKAPEEERERADVMALRKTLADVSLQSWQYVIASCENNLMRSTNWCCRYTVDTAAFMRAPKNSDFNTLSKPRTTTISEHTIPSPDQPFDAFIVVSIHNRLSWGNQYSRSSQHAVLGSNTLGDLFDNIICPSNEIPAQKCGDDVSQGYVEGIPQRLGGIICIEGEAFTDGRSKEDYASKLRTHIEGLPKAKRPVIQNITNMHERTFASLSTRVNQPYWLLHQGSCEHFVVIDEIRLLCDTDLQEGYPLTLQITPPLLDMCQACSKVPAVWSVVGDVRLGQSPCLLCARCWQAMGQSGCEGVLVVPLPRHEVGW